MAAARICTQTKMLRKSARRYLFWCANEHIEFRIPELGAVASMFKIPIKWIDKPTEDPYVVVELDCESDAKKLMSRTMLVRSCYELWGEGKTLTELHQNVKNASKEMINPHLTEDKSFKIRVETFNKTLKSNEKLAKIEAFDYLPFQGRVDLNNADTSLTLIEYYGLHPNNIPEKPFQLFFGRWLADGQRDLIAKFSLKKRKYIGSTSMDAQLSFVMANMAQVKPGHIVIDPFVGTGSILVSAAYRGGFVWGSDIDYLTLHARTKPTRHNQKTRVEGESILSNLEQYGLGHHYLDVVVMDSARSAWRKGAFADAIITDPPYGIREATERVGSTKSYKIREEHLDRHYPAKISYSLSDIFKDLLQFAATNLVIGGRLVFWLPVYRDDYTDDLIPSHPCLRLEANSEQVLATHSSRRLITLIKTRSPLEGDTATAEVAEVGVQFRERFFQAAQMSRDERLAMKSQFPRDKRGQGLGYRVADNQQKNYTNIPNRRDCEKHSRSSNVDSNESSLGTSKQSPG
ncbi:tRNA (guanine(10)-N(2))-methyltransferase TRMT11-like [Oratosquilla oratoria]|uniref:tRNA (guanine(10)-N(2))-methyltransferase TRMT11-like n=1 Tax=Oratosquilla oratoria TaxID=337810 RepID=UPI003F76D4E2